MSYKAYSTIGALALAFVLAAGIFVPSHALAAPGGQGPACPPTSNAPQCQTNGDGDSGSEDSGSEDSGSEDSGSEDSGSEDSGSEDSGSEDSGSSDQVDDTPSEDTRDDNQNDSNDDNSGEFEPSSNDESEQSLGGIGNSYNRYSAIGSKLTIPELVPESQTGLSLYEAVTGPLGFNIWYLMYALGDDWNSLSEGQMVWLLENFHTLVSGA
jgi:hypothetical protein